MCNATPLETFTPGALGRLACLFLLLAASVKPALAEESTLGFVGDAAGDAFKGAMQGINEANVQGRFLGQTFKLTAADRAATTPVAVVVDGTESTVLEVAAANPDVAVLNVGASADSLRDTCLANLLHVMPSDAMLADATSQWLTKNPDSAARSRAWHHTFRKYAASQLNIRYKEGAGIQMVDRAWAGWAAAKMISDMRVRYPDADAKELLTRLRTELEFDGQKGARLNFRPNGQLRQPLLLVDNDKIVGEAPVRGVGKGLDSLGRSECPADK